MATTECIFCGGSPTTNEDILSDWIVNLFADFYRTSGATGSRQERRQIAPDGELLMSKTWEVGDNGRLKAKCVCHDCNHGWMSKIEEAAKPALSMLITGRAAVLTLGHQEAIARWLGLKAVVEQFARSEQLVTTPDWIDAIKETHTPPDSWHIRIGRHTGSMMWMAGSVGVDFQVQHPLVPFTFRTPGFVFTFTIGHFFGQVLGLTKQPTVAIDERFFIQIWPPPLVRLNPSRRDWPGSDDVAWPPERGLSHAQVLQIGDRPTDTLA